MSLGRLAAHYNPQMEIVIPGGLPPPPYDRELAKWFAERAPRLLAWFEHAQASSADFDPSANGCTAYEAWQLRYAGAPDVQGQPIGAALGPWLAGAVAGPDEPVWVADLVHFSLGTDRASLLDPDEMDLRPAESEALIATAQPWFEGTGFALDALSAKRCRIHLPEGIAPRSNSPRMLAGQPLDAWWQLDTAMRPWRRLLNEIQMAWHDHPVNDERAARGVPPVNGLWLYGGARAWTPAAPSPATHVIESLQRPYAAGDWSAWLDALAALDAHHILPLSGADGLPLQPVTLLLLGERRSVRLTINPRGRLLRWLPAHKKNWKSWWSLPA
jgi:hypothetical protein